MFIHSLGDHVKANKLLLYHTVNMNDVWNLHLHEKIYYNTMIFAHGILPVLEKAFLRGKTSDFCRFVSSWRET